MTNKELLKVYSAYLPYKLNWFIDFEDGDTAVYEMLGLFADSGEVYLDGYDANVESKNCKPILRPLSDLTEEIEHNGEKFVPLIKMGLPNKTRVYNDITSIIKKGHTPYIEMQKLLKWHFDVFDLLGKNSAIHLNEVK